MKKIIITSLVLLTSTIIMAQPLPPSTPAGNPIPIGNILILVLLGIVTFRFSKTENK